MKLEELKKKLENDINKSLVSLLEPYIDDIWNAALDEAVKVAYDWDTCAAEAIKELKE